MREFSDRHEILERAYAALERREQQEREHAAWLARQDPSAEDALQRWKRLRQQSVEPQKRESPKPRPQPQRNAAMDADMAAAWNRWAKSHTERLHKQVTKEVETLGDEISKVTARLEKEIGQLRAEIDKLQRGGDAVLDLPDWKSYAAH